MVKSVAQESSIYRKKREERNGVEGASHFQNPLLLLLKKKIRVENRIGKIGQLRRVCATSLVISSMIR